MTSEGSAAAVGTEDTQVFQNIDSTFFDFSFVNDNVKVDKSNTTMKLEDMILKEELEKVKENRVLIQEQTKLAKLQQQLTLLLIENAKKTSL